MKQYVGPDGEDGHEPYHQGLWCVAGMRQSIYTTYGHGHDICHAVVNSDFFNGR
jgi:hypothetical protein